MARSKQIRVSQEFNDILNGIRESIENDTGRLLTDPDVTKLIAIKIKKERLFMFWFMFAVGYSMLTAWMWSFQTILHFV